MALATATQVTNAGIAETLSTPASSDTVAYPSSPLAVWMEVDNASGGSITVTVTSQANPSDGEAASDKSVSVAAAARKRFRITEAFKDSNGDINFTFSATASVTADVFYIK